MGWLYGLGVGSVLGAVLGALIGSRATLRSSREAAQASSDQSQESLRQSRIEREYPPLRDAVQRVREWAMVQRGPMMATAPGQANAYDSPPQLPDEHAFWSHEVQRLA